MRYALLTLLLLVTAQAGQVSAAAPASGNGGMCGGLAGVECAAGLFCDYPLTAQCGAADQTGVCHKRPVICPTISRPVCGCDDKTYDNNCWRRQAGVGLSKKAACK